MYHIRWMIRRDMAEVLEIEGHSFDHPWSEEDFIRCLRQRNCIGMVAEHQERIVGFMIYELHKDKLEILNIAVHQEWRRKKVFTALINKLKGKLTPQRRKTIAAIIRDRNLSAHLTFRNLEFRAVTVMRDFFDITDDIGDDIYEDGYRFVFTHQPEEASRVRDITQFYKEQYES